MMGLSIAALKQQRCVHKFHSDGFLSVKWFNPKITFRYVSNIFNIYIILQALNSQNITNGCATISDDDTLFSTTWSDEVFHLLLVKSFQELTVGELCHVQTHLFLYSRPPCTITFYLFAVSANESSVEALKAEAKTSKAK